MASEREQVELLVRNASTESTAVAEKLKAYIALCNLLRHVERHWPGFVGLNASEVLRVLLGDCSAMFSSGVERLSPLRRHVAEVALKAVVHVLRVPQLSVSLPRERAEQALRALIAHASGRTSKKMCHLGLWGLSVQKLPAALLSAYASEIFNLLQLSFASKLAVSVEVKCFKVLSRLADQIPDDMRGECEKWVPAVVKRLGPSPLAVREALDRLIPAVLPLFAEVPPAVAQLVAQTVGDGLPGSLMQVIDQGYPAGALEAWSLVVVLLGHDILGQPNLVNDLLHVPQCTFTHELAEVRISTYARWKCLIDRIEASPEGLVHGKRVRLLMTPFVSLMDPGKEKDLRVRLAALEVFSYLVQRLSFARSMDLLLDLVGAALTQLASDPAPAVRLLFYNYVAQLMFPVEEIDWEPAEPPEPPLVVPRFASAALDGRVHTPSSWLSDEGVTHSSFVDLVCSMVREAFLLPAEEEYEAVVMAAQYHVWPLFLRRLCGNRLSPKEVLAAVTSVCSLVLDLCGLMSVSPEEESVSLSPASPESTPSPVGPAREQQLLRLMVFVSGFLENLGETFGPQVLFSPAFRKRTLAGETVDLFFVVLANAWLSLPDVVLKHVAEFVETFGEIINAVRDHYDYFIQTGSALTILRMLDALHTPSARDDALVLSLWYQVASKLEEVVHNYRIRAVSVAPHMLTLYSGLALPVRRLLHSADPPTPPKAALDMWGKLYRSCFHAVSVSVPASRAGGRFGGGGGGVGSDADISLQSQGDGVTGFSEGVAGRVLVAADDRALLRGGGGALMFSVHVLCNIASLYDPARYEDVSSTGGGGASATPALEADEGRATTPKLFALLARLVECSLTGLRRLSGEDVVGEATREWLLKAWRTICTKLYPPSDVIPFLRAVGPNFAVWVEVSSKQRSGAAARGGRGEQMEGSVKKGIGSEMSKTSTAGRDAEGGELDRQPSVQVLSQPPADVKEPVQGTVQDSLDAPLNVALVERCVEAVFACVRRCIPPRRRTPAGSKLSYDSQLLELLTPILRPCFSHSSFRVRNRVLSFWQATFAFVGLPSLVYPPELVAVLRGLKDRTAIVLPGWVDVEDSGADGSFSVDVDTSVEPGSLQPSPKPHGPPPLLANYSPVRKLRAVAAQSPSRASRRPPRPQTPIQPRGGKRQRRGETKESFVSIEPVADSQQGPKPKTAHQLEREHAERGEMDWTMDSGASNAELPREGRDVLQTLPVLRAMPVSPRLADAVDKRLRESAGGSTPGLDGEHSVSLVMDSTSVSLAAPDDPEARQGPDDSLAGQRLGTTSVSHVSESDASMDGFAVPAAGGGGGGTAAENGEMHAAADSGCLFPSLVEDDGAVTTALLPHLRGPHATRSAVGEFFALVNLRTVGDLAKLTLPEVHALLVGKFFPGLPAGPVRAKVRFLREALERYEAVRSTKSSSSALQRGGSDGSLAATVSSLRGMDTTQLERESMADLLQLQEAVGHLVRTIDRTIQLKSPPSARR